MQWFLKKLVGSKNTRDIKRMNPVIQRINELEEEYQSLSVEALRAKTEEFKKRLADGETLEDLLPEAFATVKNACRRLCGTDVQVGDQVLPWEMVPYDVQLVGGIVLHQGKIAEMATGEGKTLVATLPVYLNALSGRGVHVVTVNDYLARRDADWMGTVYTYLGLTVGCIQSQMHPHVRCDQYQCDITYGTNSEFGFDYLRDNMAVQPDHRVQREHAFCIVDEIDSILIDEARTPLIISGPVKVSVKQYSDLKPAVERLYRKQRDICTKYVKEAKSFLDKGDHEAAGVRMYQVNQGMPKNKQFLKLLEDVDTRRILEKINDAMLTDMRKEEARELRENLFFMVDEKGHDASLTDKGCAAISPEDPQAYVLPDMIGVLAELEGDNGMSDEERVQARQSIQDDFADRSERIHAVDQLIRAFTLYERDVEYVVQDNRVIIVDENTGRLMDGRRWSDGLHQAVEAKEGVVVQQETQTLATITIQNYFRMYDKLSGMTGTAETEADEFYQIYKLDVVVIPTNRPVRRLDFHDAVYRTQREKYGAILEEIEDCHKRRQPVLVGTVSVDISELISRMLRRAKIPHSVLNAKNHEAEADIVARAGQPGSVTIATNMAGRGTDIKLGEGVVYVEQDVLKSFISLEGKYKDGTLRDALFENPCGLHVIGTARHESRRIDRQLRGRCSRQGDPGSSRFYISLEDDLMRLFGSDRMSKWMSKMGLEDGQVLESPILTRSLETAQKRVEQQNFSIRKRTLEYDDVMNAQRKVIYGFRTEVLISEAPREELYHIFDDVVDLEVQSISGRHDEDAMREFVDWTNTTFPVGLKLSDCEAYAEDLKGLAEFAGSRIREAYELKASAEDSAALMAMERYVILRSIDHHWQEYLRNMDALRQGVGLRAYGQRDPLVEYKKEAYDMFAELENMIKNDIAIRIFRLSPVVESRQAAQPQPAHRLIHEDVSVVEQQKRVAAAQAPGGGEQGKEPSRAGAEEAMNAALQGVTVRRDQPKVGRNDLCPCGSGKKYKKCHGAMA